MTGEIFPLALSLSTSVTIEQGFTQISRFFPGVRDILAEIDQKIVRGSLGKPKSGKARSFEDQYISTGGQLYELIADYDRFCADLRPLRQPVMDERGLNLSIRCHPYGLCTEPVGRELGIGLTNPDGHPLDNSLSIENNVAWTGSANQQIRQQIEPILQNFLRKRGLL